MKKKQLKKSYDEAVIGGYKGSFENFKLLMKKEEKVDFSEGLEKTITYDYFLRVAKKFATANDNRKNIIRTIRHMIKEEQGNADLILHFDLWKRQELYDVSHKLADEVLKMVQHFEIFENQAKIFLLRRVYRYTKECLDYETKEFSDEDCYEYLRFEKAYKLGLSAGEKLHEIDKESWVNPDPELEDEFERAEREEKEQDALDELTFNDGIEEVDEKINKEEIK